MSTPQTTRAEQYMSLSHVTPDHENGDRLRVFSIATGQEYTIDPAGDIESQIYSGIFRALQGLPKTKEEVIGSLGLNTEENKELAEAVFDSFSQEAFITSTTGLARVLAGTWQNPPVYPAVGHANEAAAMEARKPYEVAPGTATIPFDVEPLYERETTRFFDREAPIDFSDLQRILVDSYRTSSDSMRPTPSAGGIYPVQLHIISHGERVVKNNGELAFPAGIYQYNPLNLSLEQRNTLGSSGATIAEYLTDDPDATDPAVWLVLGVDVGAHKEKYGNAAQAFLGIHAGSVMQRIVEEAERLGYGTLPYFGLKHKDSDDILGNEQEIKSVLAIGIGRRASADDDPARLKKEQLTLQLDRVRQGTEDFITVTGALNLGGSKYTGMLNSFVGAWAEYPQRLSDGSIEKTGSFGTASTYKEALLKAVAEALERAASGNIRVDKAQAAAYELDAFWIDPRRVMPLDEIQMGEAGVIPFTAETRTNWTAGTYLASGEKVYAPSSLIYYPYLASENPVSDIASSGAAAHFDRDEAVQRGLMELIERDAIMRTWILQKSPDMLAPDAAPESVSYRLNTILANGKQVDLLDITQDSGVPTYMVSIRSDTFPHFFAGAAANLDPEKAMHKALDEAIVCFSTRVAFEEKVRDEEAKKRAEGIFDTNSHGMLYAEDPEMAASLNWLFEGERTTAVPNHDTLPTMDDLVKRYNPAVFDLDNVAPGNDLKVVRVVAQDLIPITFGKVGVPYLHHTLPKGVTPPAQPHFFA